MECKTELRFAKDDLELLFEHLNFALIAHDF